MNLCVDKEVEKEYDFDIEKEALKVIEEVLRTEGVTEDIEVNLTLTDNETIQELNRDYRDIDKVTDVLSFPNIDYENPSDFSLAHMHPEDYYDPETGEIYLGDIVINVFRMEEQAESYGHSIHREFCFLVAHSMLHLLGYDHMQEDEEKEMFAKQDTVLNNLQITR